MTEYSDRVDGFQIRDIIYFGKPPEGVPIRFDVVKWYPEKNPYIGTVYHSTESGEWEPREELISEHCYSVATLQWNGHEGGFDFASVGMRWLEEKPSFHVVDMILAFCEEKGKELNELDEE